MRAVKRVFPENMFLKNNKYVLNVIGVIKVIGVIANDGN